MCQTYEVKSTFLRLMKWVPGVFYEHAGLDGACLDTVLVMHSDEDYLDAPTGEQLAKRGFRVLCANVMVKEGLFFTQVEKMKAVRAAVAYLRSLEQVKNIILMGHSGGATLMTAYQAIAENGPQVFQGPEKILPYPDDTPLPPADGVMLLDANWGNAAMQLFSLDPAVVSEDGGMRLDPAYNLFEEANGFKKDGSSFSGAFIRRFQKKQGERNNQILACALDRWEKIKKGEGRYSDDEPLVIPGANQVFFNNKLYAQDIRLMSHTRQPRELIHPDGSSTVEIVRSVRTPENPESLTHSMADGARIMTVYNYLTSYAVRTLDNYGYGEDSVWGVDWDSTYCCPVGNVKHIKAPCLFMGMTAGWEFLAAETIYETSASQDKTLAFVEGANHKFFPAHNCEKFPGQFGDTMAALHDYVAKWLSAGRFDAVKNR